MKDFKVNDNVKFFVDGTVFYGVVKKVTPKKITVCENEDFYEFTIRKEHAELLEPIYLDAETYRKLARYEITVQDVVKDNVVENIVNKDGYKITLSDILAAIKKYSSHKIDEELFCAQWFCFFENISDENFHDESDNEFYNQKTIIKKIISDLSAFAFNRIDGYTDKIIAEAEMFLEDEKKPITERRYPDETKADLLRQLEDKKILNNASEDVAKLYKLFALELYEKNIVAGLLAVGYGCYGGNRVFECDWEKAEKCMLALMELDPCIPDKAYYANTLGYIYYYGRVNGGVPEYEKAYKYFSFAAFNGIYEAEYKIADMFMNGYGVIKSPATARRIISELYEENLDYIINGRFNSKFADIAFRIGKDYKDEEYPYESDFDEMLYYYSQAAFAIRMRMLEADNYGDSKVAKAIDEAINEVKEMIDFAPVNKTEILNLKYLFGDFIKRGNKLEVRAKKLANGKCKLTFCPYNPICEQYTKKMFITVPELDICGFYESFSVIARTEWHKEIFFCDNFFIVDKIELGKMLYDSIPVFICECPVFEIRKPKTDEKKHRFVSVVFGQNRKKYDYLCDIEDVKIGDKLTVVAHNKEKEVTVVNVFEKTETEMVLPIKAYKRAYR